MKLLAIILCAFPALALYNGKTIRNHTGAPMVNHPVITTAWFREGEVLDYCKPYATPSDTLIRAAVSGLWQCIPTHRWRDGTLARTITGVTAGNIGKTWTTSGGGLVSLVVSNNIATLNTSTPHGLVANDHAKGMITGSPVDQDLIRDDYVIISVPTSTSATFMTRNVNNGTITSGSPTFTFTQTLDPQAPTTAIRFYSENHNLYRGNAVVCSGVGGIAAANGTFKITGVSRNEFVVNVTGSGTYTSGGTCTGPTEGSVQMAHVAYFVNVPSGGTTQIDYVNSATPSSAGDMAATIAAGWDADEMLAASWGGQLVVTADVQAGSTPSFTIDARTMLTAFRDGGSVQSTCGPRYQFRGPAYTKLILDFGCLGALTYDFGWQIVGGTTFAGNITASQTEIPVGSTADMAVNTRLFWFKDTTHIEISKVAAVTCAGTASPCVTVTRNFEPGGFASTYTSGARFGIHQWKDGGAPYKSGHARIQLGFYGDPASPAWGVEQEWDVKNQYFTKNQTMYYSALVKTGSTPATRLTIPGYFLPNGDTCAASGGTCEFKHPANTSWSVTVTDGTDQMYFCSGGAGTDPNNCTGTGGGTRALKYSIDHNTPYLIYSRMLPQYNLHAGLTTDRWLSYPAVGSGFANAKSDKGAVGVLRPSTDFEFSGNYHPGRYLGDGTYGSDMYDQRNHGMLALSADQEGGMLGAVDVLHINGWDLGGYEIRHGVSIPGGGGNVEVQAHIPMHSTESDETIPRFVEPGFSETAFGRELTITGRGNIRWDYSQIASQLAVDRAYTACGPNAPTLMSTSNTIAQWPCYWNTTNIAADGWALSTTTTMHINDWSWLAYQTTGNIRYLELQQTTAAWLMGTNPYRLRSSGTAEGQTYERARSWMMQAWMRSYLAEPNVPQYGTTQTSAWKHYYNNKLWDMALAEEGFTQITNGRYSDFYPAQSTSCTAYNSVTDFSLWRYGRCKDSLGANLPNPLGYPRRDTAAELAGYPYLVLRGVTPWMTGYSLVQQGWWQELDSKNNHFEPIRQKTGAFIQNLAGNVCVNAHLTLIAYQAPAAGVAGGSTGPTFVQDWCEYQNAFKPTWTGGGFTHNRTDRTWNYMTDPNGAPGVGPITYAPNHLGVLSFKGVTAGATVTGCTPADRPPSGCTPKMTLGLVRRILTNQSDYPTNPKYNFIERQDIENLTITPGATTAVMQYLAPTPDPCYWAVGTTAATSSIDTADTSDGGGSLWRRVVITGLLPSTAYYLQRLTCGQRLAGFVPE